MLPIPTLDQPIERLVSLADSVSTRYLVGVVGLPGSGKTTLVSAWQSHLQRTRPTLTIPFLSMDGFHLTKAQLAQLPNPEQALQRRGAPWTFDIQQFIAKLQALKTAQSTVLWPTFEHTIGDPVPDQLQVSTQPPLVVVEGLYLLYREGAWAQLADLFDEIWFLDTPPERAYQRLLQRHQRAWHFSAEQAAARIAQNDALNAHLVSATRSQADWLIPDTH